MTLLDTAPTDPRVSTLDVANQQTEETPTAGGSRRPGPTGLGRLRLIVLLIGYTLVGSVAGGIFDRFEWTLVLAPVPPTVVSLLLLGRSVLARSLAAIASIVFAVALAVGIAGGGVGDLADVFTSGVQGLLTTDWPSPARADLIGTVAALIATATAISAELVGHRRWHLLPLVPLAALYVAVLGLAAPRGVDWVGLTGLGIVAIGFATIRDDGGLADRLMLLRGERRLVPLALSAIVIAVLVSVPVVFAGRADPRRNDPAEQSEALLDPIQASLAMQGLDPPIDLHTITPNTAEVLPDRWRTAALSNYDGQRWSPGLTLRPIGRTLGPVTGGVVDVEVSFLDDDLSLVPLPGAPVSVDAPVETDADRTVVRLLERPSVERPVHVVANMPPTAAATASDTLATRAVDDSVSGLTKLATELGGGGATMAQLRQIETTMRNDFVLDSTVQGGGLQRALMDIFLRDTRRGTAEQFATGFVLLARSLGVDARVATGYVADPSASVGADGSITLTSAGAAVWPEVRLSDPNSDDLWLAFDPVPAEEASDTKPAPPRPQTQTPAAPQPPINPPPESANDTTDTPDSDSSSGPSTLSTTLLWVARGSAVAGALVLPILLLVGLILGVKYRRRRRRLQAADARRRIRGAWASATDVLVDAGLSIRRSATDAEIARDAEPLAAQARRELDRLANLSSAATYGAPVRPDLLADDATSCLTVVEAAIGEQRSRWQRLRWRLSLRSLRSTTRSPVTD